METAVAPAGGAPQAQTMRVQGGNVGAGPPRLLLGQLVDRRPAGAGGPGVLVRRPGIEAVVLGSRSRSYVEKRVRAGVLEQPTVELLREAGVAGRLDRAGMPHQGISLRFDGADHRIAFDELTGRSITVYGQQEVIKDLIAARSSLGAP